MWIYSIMLYKRVIEFTVNGIFSKDGIHQNGVFLDTPAEKQLSNFPNTNTFWMKINLKELIFSVTELHVFYRHDRFIEFARQNITKNSNSQ